MFRKISSMVTAVVVIFAMLPAMAASAAVTATSTLSAGTSVFPGSNSYTVKVSNAGGSLFGVGGTTANYIEVILPPNLSAAACANPTVGTFTCRVRSGRTVVLDGGALASGSSVDIPFTATAAKPVDRNRSSEMEVRVSDDAGATTSSGGLLTTVVRALEVIASSVKASAPAGVIDGTGTVGQSITYTFQIKNHAQQTISVTPTFSSNGGDTAGALTAKNILTNGTATFNVPVTLGSVTGDQQARTFTVGGTKTGDTTTSAGTATGAFTVQAAPTLALTANTFTPRAVRTDGTTYNFAINANKARLPGVTGLAGSLTFAGQTIALQSPTTLPSGAANGLTFAYVPETVTGADNVYDAVFTFTGTDDNGFGFTYSTTLSQLITIDNLAPTITIGLTVPSGQQQVKNGDTIRVPVTVSGGGIDFVELQATIENPGGTPIVRTIPVTGCAVGATSCNGSATLADLGNYGTLVAVGQASDAALNRGPGQSPTVNIDNVLPLLAAPARVVEGAAYGATRPVVEVTISDRYNVAGGCNATNWDVDQTSNDPIIVTEVRYSNGQPCGSGTNPNDNIRILVVNSTIDPDTQYNVLYYNNRFGVTATSDRLSDGALNRAIDQIVQTVSGIAPALPDLATIQRNAATETAVFDADQYWTRFPGNDTQAVIRNTRAGYFIEILDGNGTVIRTTGADGSNASAIIPIGSTDGSYLRGIRLVNASGLRGDVLSVTITLDRVLPTFASSAVTTPGDVDKVTVTFNEILWAGSNRAIDWFGRERNTNPGEDPYFLYRPNSVEGSAANTRILNVNLRNNGDFAGVDFTFDAQSAQAGTRYVDRAGNPLQDFAG